MPKLALIESVSADRQSLDVLQLIADYQRAARVAVNGLKRQAATSDLLRAWRSGKLPRSGRLSEPRGRYSFHGIGCRFQIAGRKIEVDFGPSGRHDGFDASRLDSYAQSAFEWLDVETNQIEKGLKRLESQQVIVRPGLEPGTHLFYLSEDLSGMRQPAKRRSR